MPTLQGYGRNARSIAFIGGSIILISLIILIMHSHTSKDATYPTLSVKSVFAQGESIPPRYTCEGANMNPPLQVIGIPEGTQVLSIIMHDPDAPVGDYVHWVAWNLNPQDITEASSMSGAYREGINSSRSRGYIGPCPPSGTHRYYFEVYALDSGLDLPDTTDRATLERAMEGRVLAKGELMGVYERTRR